VEQVIAFVDGSRTNVEQVITFVVGSVGSTTFNSGNKILQFLDPWISQVLKLLRYQVISGINTGPNCGYEMFHSSAIAAAREALVYGVPSIAISLNCNT